MRLNQQAHQLAFDSVFLRIRQQLLLIPKMEVSPPTAVAPAPPPSQSFRRRPLPLPRPEVPLHSLWSPAPHRLARLSLSSVPVMLCLQAVSWGSHCGLIGFGPGGGPRRRASGAIREVTSPWVGWGMSEVLLSWEIILGLTQQSGLPGLLWGLWGYLQGPAVSCPRHLFCFGFS